MTAFSNFHTHTVYCDGKNTPEELVKAAVEKGCGAIGFSGHSYTFFDTSYCMTKEGTVRYREEIARLKKAYAGKIEILLGIEQDYFSAESTAPYDFVIGSVHYVLKDGAYIPVDESKAGLLEKVERYYGGDFYQFAADYYALVAKVQEKTGADIIGHFDLVTKFNRGGCLFDEEDKRYKTAALTALQSLAKKRPILEVNTGAMYRGLLQRPYPAPFLLDEAKKLGFRILLSSDSHDTASLCHAFAETLSLLKNSGFETVTVLKNGGKIQQKI